MKCVKKPIILNCFKLYEDDMPEWFLKKVKSNEVLLHTYEEYCEINTLEGKMRSNRGDYIIQGVKNEIYSCKPDIFGLTYKVVK